MRYRLPFYVAIGLFISAAFSPYVLRAQSTTTNEQQEVQDAQNSQQDAQDAQDEAPPRVARLVSLDGEVSFQRAGDSDWVAAVRNLPLLPGDQVYTGSSSHAQIQLDRDSFIWLSPGTALTIADFSNDAAQFEVTSGSATFQISRLAAAFNRFEVDTQVAAVVVTEDGLYRLRVDQSGQSQIAIKDGAADVTTSEGDLTLRDGHQLTVGPTGTDKLEVAELDPNETWDVVGGDNQTTIGLGANASGAPDGLASGSSYVQTGGAYDAHITAAPDYVASYEDANNGLYGLEDLSSYGTWTNVSSYGDCWVPNVGSGWAPYRLGEWVWIPAAGWTWLSSEPWGWAPYHYGRWSFITGLGWAWVPGFGPSYYNYGYSFYRWNPAPVYFFNWNTPQGPYVGWFPLPPGTPAHPHWHHRPSNRQFGRVPSLMPTLGVAAARSGGVSVIPVSGLRGTVPSRPQPAGSLVNSLIIGVNQPHRPADTINDGLPNITPIGSSISPVRSASGGVISTVRPPQGIIGVPVVTRRIPPTQIAGTNVTPVQREHRLVEPKAIGGPRFVPGVVDAGRTPIGVRPGSAHRDRRTEGSPRFSGGGTETRSSGVGSGAPTRRWAQPEQPHGNLSPRTYVPERPAPSAPRVVQPAPSGGGGHTSGSGGAVHSGGGGGASHSGGGGGSHSGKGH